MTRVPSRQLAVRKLVFLCLGALWLTSCQSVHSEAPPRAVDGHLDLSSWRWEKRGTVSLEGEWAFYPGQLIPPREIAGVPGPEGAEVIDVPSAWHRKSIAGKPLDGHGFATYTLRISLPQHSPQLALKVIDVGTAFDLFVDGVLVHSAGTVGRSEEVSTPGFERGLVVLPDSSRSERLILFHVSNFHYRTGGLWEHMVLGTTPDVLGLYDLSLGYGIFLASGIGVIGLYQLGLFSLSRRDHSSLYFALFCFAVVVRILSTDERYITELIPGLAFNGLIRLEYISFLLAPPAFAAFITQLVPQCYPRWMPPSVIWVGLACAVGVMLSVPRVFSEWLPLFQFYLVVSCGFGVYVLGKAVALRLEVARGFFVGFLVLVLATFNDVMVSLDVLNTPVFLVGAGFFCFIIIQSYAISLRSAQAVRSVERLTSELEAYSADLEKKVEERTLELELANKELERLAVVDGLTQIANRRHFDEALDKEWKSHRRRGAPLSVVLCDIDFFKAYNDTYGHLKGDEVLCLVASSIQAALSRPNDMVARYGGEEFVMLLPDTSLSGATDVAERMRRIICELHVEHQASPHGELSLSLGVASMTPSDSSNKSQLVGRADESLYRAKGNGRNRVEACPEAAASGFT